MIGTSAVAITPNCDYDIRSSRAVNRSDCGNNSRNPENGEQSTCNPVGSWLDRHSRVSITELNQRTILTIQQICEYTAQLAGFRAIGSVCGAVPYVAPLQQEVVEPSDRVLEWAEWMYEENDPDKDREEYISEIVVDAIEIQVDLGT